jgi:proline racemase
MPVFTLARVIGEKPRREWLLYAHAPMGDRTGVEVAIPDYGPVRVDVSLGGSFYLVSEADRSVTAVGR